MDKKKKEEKLIKDLALEIEKRKKEVNGIYVLNPENYSRFMKVFEYLKKFVLENEGNIVEVVTAPEEIHCGIQMDIPILDLYHGTLIEFTEILKMVDVFGITPTTEDTLLIDFTVNDVWKVVQNNTASVE